MQGRMVQRSDITRGSLTATALALGALVFAPTMAFAATADPSTPTPRIPATNGAKSPFAADRPGSEPLGLSPNDVRDPFTYPSEAVVLTWSPVPGAVSYVVEIATNPTFTKVARRIATDQPMVAPDVLLPDGGFWWRVSAFDAAGTKGASSQVARFAKAWPSEVTGGVLAATPNGPNTTQIQLNPYLSWNPVAGATYYEVQVAPADQFATPTFSVFNLTATSLTPGVTGVLPDDGYQWRVRPFDQRKNPGNWTTFASATKAWVTPTVTAPADAATTHDLSLKWNPVPGAEKYQVQITIQQFNWEGSPLKVDGFTAETGFVPAATETSSIPFGNVWWRVRPVVKGIYGTWSASRNVNWQDATIGQRTATAQLASTGDSDTALTPQMAWTPVVGANIYRVDIATDDQFNNLVERQYTRSTSWVTRLPLNDNMVRDGFFWRVVWGSGTTESAPGLMVDEDLVAEGSFRKQTRVTLGSADAGTVTEPPLLTWSQVSGAARYEVSLSQDQEFDKTRTRTMTIWGTGSTFIKFNEIQRLIDGTWFWRVRAIDGASVGQTWSPVGRFTLISPRPTLSTPRDGATVVGSPLLRWTPVEPACSYQVQLATDPSFENASTSAPAGGSVPETGLPTEDEKDPTNAIGTEVTAAVPTGKVISSEGQWYWRVRTACDDERGQWSAARSFISVKPPQFNLNRLPTEVTSGRPVVVSGQLKLRDRAVRSPKLVLERRVWPERDYRAYGLVRGEAQGKFAFTLKMDRSAAWRLVWAQTDDNPEGIAPFAINVRPKATLRLTSRSVERNGRLTLTGSVSPRRPAEIQIKGADGWETLATVPGRARRFRASVKVTTAPGKQLVRLWVPTDAEHRLEASGTAPRSVLVFDRFTVRRG
jgi:hypothetical protein